MPGRAVFGPAGVYEKRMRYIQRKRAEAAAQGQPDPIYGGGGPMAHPPPTAHPPPMAHPPPVTYTNYPPMPLPMAHIMSSAQLAIDPQGFQMNWTGPGPVHVGLGSSSSTVPVAANDSNPTEAGNTGSANNNSSNNSGDHADPISPSPDEKSSSCSSSTDGDGSEPSEASGVEHDNANLFIAAILVSVILLISLIAVGLVYTLSLPQHS